MSQSQRIVAVSGGGTGGHIFPALSIADRLKKRGVKIIYIGSSSGIEKDIVKLENIYLLPVIGWVDRNLFGKFAFIVRFIPSVIASIFLILGHRVDTVLLTGGFVSVPVGLAGILLRKPLFTLVLDMQPGLAVRLFSRYSKEVFLPFEDTLSFVPGKSKVITGIPIREGILDGDRNEALKYFELDSDKRTILILGGSRGARALVKLADKLIDELEVEWQFIIHRGNYKLRKTGKNVKSYRFIERMDLAYAAADIIISRAGAMLTSEIEKSGIPAIFIPYPYSALDHQYYNAKRVAENRSNIVVLRERDVNTGKIVRIIKRISGNKYESVIVDSAGKIVERMEKHVWKN